MIEQFDYGRDHAHDAEVQYQKATFGLKLGLSYIRKCFQEDAVTEEKRIIILAPLTHTHTHADARCCVGIFSITVEASLVFFLYVSTPAWSSFQAHLLT